MYAESMTVNQGRLVVKLAEYPEELRQAMRLRYESFIEEHGNRHAGNDQRMETDSFDAWCDHLIVTDESTGQVVGTYRLLPGERAIARGGFYSETLFDLTHFVPPKHSTLELGRSCIHPLYRNGRVVQLLWEGIADYVKRYDYLYLIGCASLRVTDSSKRNLIHSLLNKYDFLTERYGVQPLPHRRIADLRIVETGEGVKELFRLLPPLVKGYLWVGAELAAEPVYDPHLTSVDYFVVLEKEKITEKYRRHFLER
jgi:putative hemolysin